MASYYLVSRNSDLTEGRGRSINVVLCRCLSTAERLAARINVQGSDGDIETITPFVYENTEYIPIGKIPIQEPSEQDLQEEKKYAAIQRARIAGLSEEDIRSLMS